MNQINIKPIWSILCQEYSIDNITNNLSLFKVLEEVQFGLKMEQMDKLKDDPNYDPSKPIVLPFKSYLVILWKNLNTNSLFKFPIRLIFKDPSGNVLQDITNNFEFPSGKERLRTIITLDGVPLTKPGEYIYSILTKASDTDEFEEVCTVPINIKIDLQRSK